MPQFFGPVLLNNNPIQDVLVHPTATDVASPVASQIWFNTVAGTDGQGRLKVKLATRTMMLDDQYVGSVGQGTGGIVIGGTALAPTVSLQAASATVPGYFSAADYSTLHAATSSATANTLVARDASGAASFSAISISGAPVNSTDGVNKAYADSLAAGFDPKASCVLGTTGALPSNVYANGTAGVGATLTASANQALTSTLIDGTSSHTLAVGNRIVVKNEAAGANNGIYVVTDLGSASSKWVLTRAADFNTPTLVTNGAFTSVEQGSLAGTVWMVTGLTDAGLTFGTTAITLSSFGVSQVYTAAAGGGLNLAANAFSINLSGTSTLEVSGSALRVKSSATAGQPLLSAGSGAEAAYGPISLAGGANVVTGVLPVANGGTGVATGGQNLVFATPTSGSGAPGLRALAVSDLPALAVANISGAAADATGSITGDGTTKSFSWTHGLGRSRVKVTVFTSTGEEVFPTVTTTSTTATIVFGNAPANAVVFNLLAVG